MNIDASHYETGQFGFYIQTNGPVDARNFRDFLDLISGNSYANRSVAPLRVEILELSSGSIRGRMQAWFREIPWGKSKLRTVQRSYEANLLQSQAALRQADAAELAAALAGQANTLAAEGNKRLAVQNGIALATFLSGVVATIYANIPSTEAERIAKLMEIDGVSRIEIATKNHSWSIERKDVADYREALMAAPRIDRRGDIGRRASRFNDEISRDALDAEALAAKDATILRRVQVAEEANIALSPARQLTAAVEAQKTRAPAPRLTGMVTEYGDAYRFTTDGAPGSFKEFILIPPDERQLSNGTIYTVTGRIIILNDEMPLLVAKSVRRPD